MPNGTPPAATNRRYDLLGGRGIVAQAKQRIAQVEPAGELEALLKQAMLDTAELLETTHALIALQESQAQRALGNLDRLASLMRHVQQLRTQREDASAMDGAQDGEP